MTNLISPFETPHSIDSSNIYDQSSNVFQDAYNKVVSLKSSIDNLVEISPRLIDGKVRVISLNPGPYTFDLVTGNLRLNVGGVIVNISLSFGGDNTLELTASEYVDILNSNSTFNKYLVAFPVEIKGKDHVLIESKYEGISSSIYFYSDTLNTAGEVLGFPVDPSRVFPSELSLFLGLFDPFTFDGETLTMDLDTKDTGASATLLNTPIVPGSVRLVIKDRITITDDGSGAGILLKEDFSGDVDLSTISLTPPTINYISGEIGFALDTALTSTTEVKALYDYVVKGEEAPIGNNITELIPALMRKLRRVSDFSSQYKLVHQLEELESSLDVPRGSLNFLERGAPTASFSNA